MKKLSSFLCVMVLVFGLGVTVHALSNNHLYSRVTLRGLTSSRILVKVFGYNGKSIETFKSAIIEDLERELRIGGIRVDPNSNNSIELFINIIEVPKAPESFMYVIEIAVFQKGRLMRNENASICDVCTWSLGYYGLCHSMTKIRGNVKKQIDVFINAYLSVNPGNIRPGRDTRWRRW
jgi:hypothetical protein